MAGAITDLLTQATTNSRPSPTQVTTARVGGGTTLACNALTGWPTATAVHFVTYKIDTSGNKIAGSQIDMKGVVSGTNITNIVVKAGTDGGNAIGDIVEASPTAAWANDVVAWGTAHANQDGSLITAAVQAALGLGTLNGYTPVGFAPSTVTYNGNRSYSLLFTGQDLTSFLSPGVRLRTTRTVAAPTQCTNLNGSTQFYNKTSPAGMTFTNNFVVSAWVKLASYTQGGIISRYNGTSGWILFVNSSGQLTLQGLNAGSSNISQVVANQSLPLNKWVHIAAQLDMATFTASPTTSYMMIDGADVPAVVSRSGTNPTALIQAGNLEIGSFNGGTSPFPGKIAQAAIYSAKVTEATITASVSQSLAGTETSLISAYSFNNTINDLNTTNANNLTANGSAVATNADSPYGYQAGGAISSTLDYSIIQTVAFSTNTTVVVQVAEGCTIPTTGGVASAVYSSNKAPYAFPVQRSAWTMDVIMGNRLQNSGGAQGTWFNLGWQINVPIGAWQLSYAVYNIATAGAGTTFFGPASVMSTTNNGATEADMWGLGILNSSSVTEADSVTSRTKFVNLAAATIYFLNVTTRGGTSNTLTQGTDGTFTITSQMFKLTVENAYL